jgi:Ser/Thr protein kinase RdoA (MazF antagonist)
MAAAAARLAGGPLTDWRPVTGGYTAAARFTARRANGTRVFVKAATSAPTCEGLHAEWRVYASVRGPFLPAVVGFDPSPSAPVLLLEDLSSAHWPPPWRSGDVEAVRRALAAIARATPPESLPEAETHYRADFSGWARVAQDPAPFLSLGLASAAWLARALPTLVRAEQAAVLAGAALLHLDVRSDNIALRGGEAVLVDWNWACRGNPDLDLACWAPSLAMEGGPKPEALLPSAPELAAAVSGFFGSRAGLPPGDLPPRVRDLQRRQLLEALPWAARALGLSP